MAASVEQQQQQQAGPAAPGAQQGASIPSLFMFPPMIRDALETDSSNVQDDTVDEVLPFLTGKEHSQLNAHGIPRLDKERHVRFVKKQLGVLPSMYVGADPSRPWIFYWCLNALSLLGEDLEPYRARLIETVRPIQNKTGGFGGGFGQSSHLATTYAIVLSLALVGGDEAFEVVDRRSMWKWLCQLKQEDGGFQMAVGGEEDVRGAYCASVVISLLKLPLDLSSDSPAYAAGHTSLLSGLGEWVRLCQTYEGGVSANHGVEAHGAYAFCALGCLSIIDSPHRSIRRYSDAYHTCYVLSGLSSAQNKWRLVASRADETLLGDDLWEVLPHTKGEQIFDEDDRIGTIHPVYAIPQHRVDAIRSYFSSKEGF
ncbi:protein farnesyltransferase subunit beta [Trichoderma asperellum]|uniref:Protein farnesyltransferase subunit beta n=1 Tax=Trichoderma asperellum TaxID=101201 RepID=A0A6V8QPT6_TRIAP|nr:protein farnesyltransferase subunit beta [Trichoderma asperellum]